MYRAAFRNNPCYSISSGTANDKVKAKKANVPEAPGDTPISEIPQGPLKPV
jgi:hypothetical protein